MRLIVRGRNFIGMGASQKTRRTLVAPLASFGVYSRFFAPPWGRQAGGMDARTALRDLVIGLKRDDILMPIWKGALGFGLYRINEDFLLKCARAMGSARGGIAAPSPGLGVALAIRVHLSHVVRDNAPVSAPCRASPVNRLGQGRCPVSISTYDVLARKTVIWTEGDAHKASNPRQPAGESLCDEALVESGPFKSMTVRSPQPRWIVVRTTVFLPSFTDRGRQLRSSIHHAARMAVRRPSAR